MSHIKKQFIPLAVAVLTVSDTRNQNTDTSGEYLDTSASASGHNVVCREIVIDDIYQIRAKASNFIADQTIQVVLITGGTGFSNRDSTPEALMPLFDKQVEGFGELFRQLSFREIGTATIQSRAIAGMANDTAIFCMPGSTKACRTAWDGIIQQQLDSTHDPCNFVPHLKQSWLPECETRFA